MNTFLTWVGWVIVGIIVLGVILFLFGIQTGTTSG